MELQSKACCSASRQQIELNLPLQSKLQREEVLTIESAELRFQWHSLPGGVFRMGTDDGEGFPADGEGPARLVEISSFRLSAYTVTNAQFQTFVQSSGYVTEAERFGWSFVFQQFVSPETLDYKMGAVQGASWWLAIEGADWRRPEGPHSSIEDRLNHPVVHISWNDAMAFCDWSGTRLPTEAEWEYAARGGLDGKRYPWGDVLHPEGKHMCNIWQGRFPVKNHGSDGYIGTAPVDAFEPNGYGLYNVSGNVWEWCSDWFSPQYHQLTSTINPSFMIETDKKSMRGGSYLCHRTYCNRYRVAARNGNTPDSSSGHTSFRVAIDAQ